MILAANGSMTTTEGGTVYVRDLDMFITVQYLGDSPAVLSLGKLHEEAGCSVEWKEGP